MIESGEAKRPNPNVYYDLALRKFADQLRTIESLDTKTATVFSFGSSILALYGLILTVSRATNSHGNRATLSVLLIAGFLAYVAALWFLYRAYAVRGDWQWRPKLDDLESYSKTLSEEQLRYWVAQNCRSSFEDNRVLVDRKAHSQQIGIGLIALETALVAGTGFVALFT